MKKNTLILLIGAALGIFTYRYFLSESTNKKSSPVNYGGATVTYLGPDLSFTGLVTRSGDVISGTLNPDGSLNYTMSGNGIVASSKLFVIPKSQYEVFLF